MYIARIIPEGVLDRVRGGARGALLESLAALSALAEQEPEGVRGAYTAGLLVPIERLVRLLDGIGWSAEDIVPEVAIDIDADGPVLCEALSEAMWIATLEIKEARPCARQRVRRSMLPLAAFAALVKAGCIERPTCDPAVFFFHGDLEVFLSEMERRCSGRTNHPTSRSLCRSAA